MKWSFFSYVCLQPKNDKKYVLLRNLLAEDLFRVVQSILGNQGKQIIKDCRIGRTFVGKLLLDKILGSFFNFKK